MSEVSYDDCDAGGTIAALAGIVSVLAGSTSTATSAVNATYTAVASGRRNRGTASATACATLGLVGYSVVTVGTRSGTGVGRTTCQDIVTRTKTSVATVTAVDDGVSVIDVGAFATAGRGLFGYSAVGNRVGSAARTTNSLTIAAIVGKAIG